jgi:phasin family protein
MADKKIQNQAAKPSVAAKVAQAMPTAAAAAPKAAAAPAAKPVEAAKAAAPAPKVAAPAAKPVEAPKAAAPAPKPVEAPKAAAPAAKPVEAPKAAAPAPAAKPVEAAKPAIPAPAATVAAATATITDTINKGTETMNMNMNTETMTREAAQNSQVVTERVQAAFGDINERARTAMEKSTKLVEEMTDLAKGNIEAVVASSKVAARGVETLSQEAADYGRRSFEQASNAFKSFAEVKSPTEFFKLQSDFARSAFDGVVAETSKMSEAMIKLAGEVAEPISSRYAIAAERVKTAAL